MIKKPPANARDSGLIPASGKSPGERNGEPLQYSCLGNPMDRGAYQAIVHRVTRDGHDLVTQQQKFKTELLNTCKILILFTIYKWFISFLPHNTLLSCTEQLLWNSQVALVGKNLPAKARVFLGSGRSPGERHGNPLQQSCLENLMDRGAWWARVHRVTKSRTQLKQLSTCILLLTGVKSTGLKSESSRYFQPKQVVSLNKGVSICLNFLIFKMKRQV